MIPNGSVVACRAAPSHDHAKPDWPCANPQGLKWSDDMAQEKPAASAERTSRISSEGENCSCDAWNPILGMFDLWPRTQRWVIETVPWARPDVRPRRQ